MSYGNNELTKEQVKELFGVTSFRELSTEKAFNVANKLSELKPEVAMKVLEQFPECAQTIVNLGKGQVETAKAAMEQGDKANQRQVDSLNRIIGIIEVQLQNEELTFNERIKLNEQVIEVAKLLDTADERQHNHIQFVLDRPLKGLLGLGGLAICVLVGGKFNLPIPGKKAA